MKRRKIGFYFLVLLLMTAVVAFFTNPGKEKHMITLKQKADDILTEVAVERYDIIGAGAWKLTGDKLLNEFLAHNFYVDDYKLFSVPKIQWDNKSYPVGFGIFGKVYITGYLKKRGYHTNYRQYGRVNQKHDSRKIKLKG